MIGHVLLKMDWFEQLILNQKCFTSLIVLKLVLLVTGEHKLFVIGIVFPVAFVEILLYLWKSPADM